MARQTVEQRTYEARIRQAFLRAIQRLTDSIKLTDIEAKDAEHIMTVLDIDRSSLRDMLEQVREMYKLGGDTAVKGVSVDVGSTAAADWLALHGAELVTRITEQQRKAIAEVLAQGRAMSRSTRNVALDIIGRRAKNGKRTGGVIGLADTQASAVANARRELLTGEKITNYFNRSRRKRGFDASIKRYLQAGEAVPITLANNAVAAYADNLLKFRGETIAQTEAQKAYNAGKDEVWRQQIEKGKAERNEVVRIWRAVMDDKTRDQHADMDGQERGLDEPFTDPDGNQYMYPGDSSLGAPASLVINCRCQVQTFKRALGVRRNG